MLFIILVTSDIIARAKSVSSTSNPEAKFKGPIRIPTKHLKITTRKTPNGEGSKTWDAYEMRIHKRIIDLYYPLVTVKKITSFKLEPGVEVEVTMAA